MGSYFNAPKKLINEPQDVEVFKISKAHSRIVTLISKLSNIVVGHEVPDKIIGDAPILAGLVGVFEELSVMADQIEPEKGKQRYGNVAVRKWHLQLENKVPDIFQNMNCDLKAFVELGHYFLNAFGSAIRLDYGTGHELNFLAFFGGLIEVTQVVDLIAENVLFVFSKYFGLCRKLVLRYNLEPAGSHGVWGLDDHFYMPYVLGSAQLSYGADNGVNPSMFLDTRMVAELSNSNLFFGAINFILQTKKGNFFEHSPMLYDISGISSWTKIHRGMCKLYVEEVLNKFPVIQHFYLGTIYSIEKEPESRIEIEAKENVVIMPPPQFER